MEKITLILALCVTTLLVNAQILLDEKFPDFPTSDMPSTSSANGWTNHLANVGIPNAKDFRTLAAPLNYADLSGVPALSGLGFSIFNDYTGATGQNYITYKSFSATPITTGKIYMSFLWNVYKAGGSQGEVMGLTDSIHRNACRMWIRPSTASAFILGLTRASGASAEIHVSAGSTYNFGQTYFVVLKYDLDTKIASVFMNPVIGSSTESTPTLIDDGSAPTLPTSSVRSAMQFFMFRNGGSNKGYYNVSGIRICTSWTDAVAALALPKVTTPTMGSVSGIGKESFTASWTPTTDCIGYTVLVYNGTTLFSKTDVPAKTTSSILVAGLISNTTYTYKVQAKGDNVTSGNSEPSAASSSFTTLDGATSLNPNFADGTWGDLYPNSLSEPLSGAFPTFMTTNGYLIQNGLLSGQKILDISGDSIKTCIKLDRSGGTVVGSATLTLPSMKAVKRVEIHAWTSRRNRPFVLQQLLTDGSWQTVQTYASANDTINHQDTIVVTTMNNTAGTKLRILNTNSGSLWIGRIKVDAVINGLANNYSNASLYAIGKTIVSSEPGMLTIYNLQGIQLSSGIIENRRATTLNRGIYIIRFKGRDGLSTTKKLLIQ